MKLAQTGGATRRMGISNVNQSKHMDKYRAIWNSRYKKVLQSGKQFASDPWLIEWLHLVPGKSKRALDVGCGVGVNTRLLVEHGYEVNAIDFSVKALEQCKMTVPEANIECVDIRQGIPFADESFELVVADLSLHYFSLDVTAAIIGDIAKRLVPEGLFAGRFNSTNDINYGAGTGMPINDEPDLYIVNGIEKRFFTRECFGHIFDSQWEIVFSGEKTTSKYGNKKVFWEVVAKKFHEKAGEPSLRPDR
jgi:SAM-dependent methyltransferase